MAGQLTLRPSPTPLMGRGLDILSEQARGLIAWWPLNEQGGGIAHDLCQRKVGTMPNHDQRTCWVGSPAGGALNFDGDNDFVELGTIEVGSALQLTDAFTVMLWFNKRSGGDGFQRLIDKSSGGNGANGWCIWVSDSAPDRTNEVGFSIRGGTRIYRWDQGYTHGQWHHVSWGVPASGAGDLNYYTMRDGEDFEGIFTVGASSTAYPPAAATGCRIGRWNHSTGREFGGLIRDVRIYDRRLHPSEVKTIYEETRGAQR